MGASKSFQFPSELQLKANVFAALAHPGRIQLLYLVHEFPFLRPKDLSTPLRLSSTTIQRYLRQLERSGLIQYNYVHHCYELVVKNQWVIPLIESQLFEVLEIEKIRKVKPKT